MGDDKRNWSAWIVAALVTLVWAAWAWSYGFEFADEGYFWYGVQRAGLGEVPQLDYMAYDVGRYYLMALGTLVFGDGLMPVRLIAWAWQGGAVAAGLYVLVQSVDEWRPGHNLWLVIAAVLLTLWMFPYVKAFNYLSVTVTIALAYWMLRSQSIQAWVLSGVGIGLLAIIGRNYGVYGVASVVIIVCGLGLGRVTSVRRLGMLSLACAGGVLLGYIPNLLMTMFVPGYAKAMVDSVLMMFEQGSTNIPLPVPWPWKVDWQEGGVALGWSNFMQGVGYMLLLVFPVGVAWGARAKWMSERLKWPLLACAAVAFPHAHYAFSRPDLAHLSQSMVPLILGGLMVAIRLTAFYKPLALAAMTLYSASATAFGNSAIALGVLGIPHESVRVGGADIYMTKSKAQQWRWAQSAIEQCACQDSFLALPNMMSIHASYGTRMPVWEIYPLVTRNPAFQRDEIAALEANPPKLLLLSDHRLDGKPASRFSDFHQATFEWMTKHYRRIDVPVKMADDYYIVMERSPGSPAH